MAYSQNGWYAYESYTHYTPFPWITGRVAPEVYDLFNDLCRRFNREVEEINPSGSWGWAYRSIRGSSTDLSNHCLAGDTEVVTDQGRVPIADLEGQTVRLLAKVPDSSSDRGEWVDAPVRRFADEPTYVVTVGRGSRREQFRATEAHRWFTQRKSSHYLGNYKSEYRVVTDEKHTLELKVGDRLVSALPPQQEPGLDPDAVVHGIVYGDGTYHPSGTTFVRLWGPKIDLDDWLPEDRPRTPKRLDSGVTGIEVRGLPPRLKEAPSLDEDDSYLAGWLAGYIATDGSTSGGELTLSSRKREDIDLVSAVAARLGIATRRPGKTQQNSGYKPGSWQHSISFVWQTAPDWLLIRDDQGTPAATQGRAKGWKVLSVEPSGIVEPTYCATVEGYGSFVIGEWILTGNSSGTALDLNAPQHPLGQVGTFTNAQERAIHRILEDFPQVRWGGDYWGRKDEMHFEINVTPSEFHYSGGAAGGTTGGRDWFDMATDEDLERVVEKVVREVIKDIAGPVVWGYQGDGVPHQAYWYQRRIEYLFQNLGELAWGYRHPDVPHQAYWFQRKTLAQVAELSGEVKGIAKALEQISGGQPIDMDAISAAAQEGVSNALGELKADVTLEITDGKEA